MDIILYLIQLIQHLYKQNCWLVLFICKYIPLKQWAYDDSHSPKYQKFKIDTLPKIICHKQDWQWSDLLSYYKARYNKDIKPVFRNGECTIPEDLRCLSCNAPVQYISCGMMARKNPRFFVKSSSSALILAPTQDFPRTILSNALIVAIPLFIKKTVSTLLYINEKTLSVLTISTDLNTSVKIFPLMKSQNISFITSTVNSR